MVINNIKSYQQNLWIKSIFRTKL